MESQLHQYLDTILILPAAYKHSLLHWNRKNDGSKSAETRAVLGHWGGGGGGNRALGQEHQVAWYLSSRHWCGIGVCGLRATPSAQQDHVLCPGRQNDGPKEGRRVHVRASTQRCNCTPSDSAHPASCLLTRMRPTSGFAGRLCTRHGDLTRDLAMPCAKKRCTMKRTGRPEQQAFSTTDNIQQACQLNRSTPRYQREGQATRKLASHFSAPPPPPDAEKKTREITVSVEHNQNVNHTAKWCCWKVLPPSEGMFHVRRFVNRATPSLSDSEAQQPPGH